MSRRRRHTGRVSVDFAVIEQFAARVEKDVLFGDGWTLSRKSSLHRCKNGSITACLIWRSSLGNQLSAIYRGLQLEVT